LSMEMMVVVGMSAVVVGVDWVFVGDDRDRWRGRRSSEGVVTPADKVDGEIMIRAIVLGVR